MDERRSARVILLDAARRELAEELGVDITLTGPVHAVASTFEHEGKLLDNTDVFFLGRHEPEGVALHFATEAERAAMKELKWWTIEDIERPPEIVFPADLAKVLRRLVEQRIGNAVTALGRRTNGYYLDWVRTRLRSSNLWLHGEVNFMLATAGTLLSAAVTVLAVLLGLYTMMLVGRMRGKHGVHAPAVTGAPEFERAFRVQMNTLEQFVLFLPLLWLATIYPVVSGFLAPGLGLIWLIGRVLYSLGYMADAAKRSSGFLIAGVALLGLLVLSIVGIVHAWLVTRPI